MEDYRDDADRADELEERPAVDGPEAPEADALEQAAPLEDPTDDESDTVGDAPEADALEQRRGVGTEGEEERR